MPDPYFAPAGGIRPLAFAAHGSELYLLLDDLQALWWDPLKTLDPSVEITGLACDRNGARLTVGTSTGRVISYSVRREQPRIVDTVEGTIGGIAYPSTLRITDLSTNPVSVETPGYAVSRPGVWADGSVIRSVDAAHWEVVATAMPDGRAVKGMSVDHDNQVVYAMTLVGIWKGSDGGATWTELTRDGLPRALNQSEIRFVDHPTDGPVLYLSTWGNSVWRLQV